MDFPLMLTDKQVAELEYEVIPTSLKTHLTRFLRRGKAASPDTLSVYWQNDVINRARTIAELSIYVLESDDLGEYMPQELRGTAASSSYASGASTPFSS